MIDVHITPRRPSITVNIGGQSKESIQVDVGAPHSGTDFPVYTGPTLVEPDPYYMQILETQRKAVKDNIVVLPIPYFETSNPAGGTTVYIGD